jgi:5-methylcytosine-specific restriction endonuclease McrA
MGQLLETALADLAIPDTPETRALLARLASDSAALHRTVRRIAAARRPRVADLPDVDGQVDARMESLFGNCIRTELLRKRSRMGAQNRLLLSVLLERVGEPVPLQELLLVNGLHNATSRRLRELETEHGHFTIHVEGTGDSTAYVLEHDRPDIDATAYYWLKYNIRALSPNRITPHERLLSLLSARLGQAVPLDDLAYVLPKRESGGKGVARAPQLAVARRIRELREKGWQVHSGETQAGLSRSDYLLDTLERLAEYERIKARDRTAALERANYRCEQCGWGPADGVSEGRKQLEVHHKIDPQRTRAADVHRPENLETLCNRCHAGVESDMKRRIPSARDSAGD